MDISKKLWLNLFARKRFHKFNNSLLRRSLAGVGVNDYGPRQNRGEHFLLEKLARFLPSGATVCDVGAHIGSYSLFLAQRRPDLSIHAFEPNPALQSRLTSNAVGHFTVHPFALGDQTGYATLHDPKSDGGSECASLVSGAVDTLYADQKKQTTSVQVQKLDDVADELKLSRIDYLKIDAEGYDLMVLRGASGLIQEKRIGIIQFEFNKMNVFSRVFMHDFMLLLPRHRFHRIVQDGLIPLGPYNPVTWELFGYQNIVALPEDTSTI